MRQIASIIVKEFKLLLRDPGGVIMLFILPASFIFILSIALQGTFSSPDKKEKLSILVVNLDKGDVGIKIIEGLENTEYFKAITQINGKKLSLDDAKEALQKGKYRIIVNIPKDTTKALDFQKDATVDVFVDPVLSSDFAAHITNAVQNFVYLSIIKNISEISINIFSEIKTKRIDEMNKQLIQTKIKKDEIVDQLNEFKNMEMDEEIKLITEELYEDNIKQLNEKIDELYSQIKVMNKQKFLFQNSDSPDYLKKNIGLMVNQVYYSSLYDTEIFPNSVQQNVPGWTIFALFWIVQVLSINIIAERQSGAFKRIIIAPISSFQFIIGKITPFLIINIIQAIFMFSIGIFILPLFGCPALIIKNVIGLILITIAISFVAISLGLLFASISKTLFLAASLSASVLILMTVIGGIMVPRFIMPLFMQRMSLLVPHSWALDGYLNILVRDYNIIQILPNIGVLLGFALIFFIIAFFYFNKMIKAKK